MITPSIEEHSASETGISATESAMCEMSRQASNTESAENPEVAFSVLDELVKLSGNDDNLSDKSEDTLARSNSDSTERAQSEGDNSDLSTPSQTDQESRKGSDVSESDSSALSSISFKKSLTFPISSSNKSEEQKLDIPSSMKLQKPSEISISMTKSKDMKFPHLPNTENVFPVKGSVCEEDSIESTICEEEDVIKSTMCEQDAQTDATHIQEDINNSVYGHDSICEQDAQTDATHIQEDIKNSVYEHDSICDQDDSFVVIDNNSNIHDNHVKDSSNSDFSNIHGENEDHILFSTHL